MGICLPAVDAREQRRRDPLYSHRMKHLLAALPSVAMGERLPSAISSERVAALMQDAQEGRLVAEREAALYFEVSKGSIAVPQDSIQPQRSRELILFAIEAFDDALVGYTELTFALGRRTDTLFAVVAG